MVIGEQRDQQVRIGTLTEKNKGIVELGGEGVAAEQCQVEVVQDLGERDRGMPPKGQPKSIGPRRGRRSDREKRVKLLEVEDPVH